MWQLRMLFVEGLINFKLLFLKILRLEVFVEGLINFKLLFLKILRLEVLRISGFNVFDCTVTNREYYIFNFKNRKIIYVPCGVCFNKLGDYIKKMY